MKLWNTRIQKDHLQLISWQQRETRTQDLTREWSEFPRLSHPYPLFCARLIHTVAGRPDEVQIVVANSELAIERGDFDKALNILGDVQPESPAYVRVQVIISPSGQRLAHTCAAKD